MVPIKMDFLFNYLRLVLLWLFIILLIIFLDIFSSYTRHYVTILIYIAAIINPALAWELTKKRLNKQTEEVHSPKNLLTITYLVTFIVLSSPWLFSTVQDIYYAQANQETIASIQEVAKEKGFSVKAVQFGNKVDLFETKWVKFVIFLEVGTPKGSSYAEIEDFMEKIKFNRDTIIDLNYTISPGSLLEIHRGFARFFFDYSRKQLKLKVSS